MSRRVSFDQIVSRPISSFRHLGSSPSFVIRRQLLLRSALRLIVINPELRMFLGHDRRNLIHGLERSLLVRIVAWDITTFEAGLEMRNVAAKNHRSGFWKPHEQR